MNLGMFFWGYQLGVLEFVWAMNLPSMKRISWQHCMAQLGDPFP